MDPSEGGTHNFEKGRHPLGEGEALKKGLAQRERTNPNNNTTPFPYMLPNSCAVCALCQVLPIGPYLHGPSNFAPSWGAVYSWG